MSEGSIGDQCRNGNHDPRCARAFVACCAAGRSHTPPTLWAHYARPSRDSGLAEAGDAAIGGVAQHTPHDRAFPATAFARRYAFGVEPAGDLAAAEAPHR